MSDDTATFGFQDAARRLGVPIRVLRRAIRTGRLPAPPQLDATATIPDEWLDGALAQVAASPKALSRSSPQKVPPFARYVGTSAWRKYSNRAREYAEYCARTTSHNPPAGAANP